MTKRFLSLFILVALACSLFACSGNKEAVTTAATLRWTGMVAADGCGYFLDIDGKEYKPSNEEIIPESFQTEEAMPVVVTYEPLEEAREFSCGMLPTRYSSTIKLTEIKTQE